MATLRLPSGEMRMVRAECRATIGTIGNADHQNVKIGKAGRKRHMGVRPQTRGTAMNPVDHPHGGGEGSTTAGPPPGHAVGRADARLPHAQEEQGVRPLHRPRPPPREGQEPMSRSSKKGPWVEERLMARIEAMNEREQEAHGQDLVARPRRSSRRWSATRSPCTTAASTCPCSSSESMVGHKLGEFAPTRTYRGHAGTGKVAT